MVPRFARVPSPEFVTVTAADVGVVVVVPCTAVKLTVLVLTESTGWRMVKFTAIGCGLLVAPVAVTGTETPAGLAVRPFGLAVNVSVVLPATAHVSHDAGLAGQLTVPSDPPPLFVTVTVCGAGAELPRTAWKTSACCDSAMRGIAATATVTAIVFDTLS